MTKSQKPDAPAPIDPELERILVEERADEAWAEYVMDERPSALARYLILGGEVTDVVRAALIDALRDHQGGRKGGSRPYRDWQTFLEIELIRKWHASEEMLGAIHGGHRETVQTSKMMSVREAAQIFADQYNRELRTVQQQHVKGKTIEAQFKNAAKK